MSEVETTPQASGDIKAERCRAAEIIALGNMYNMADDAMRAVENGESTEAFRTKVLSSRPKVKPLDLSNVTYDDLKDRKRSFSLMKLIAHHADPGSVDAGFEVEVSKELAMRSGRSPRGAFVPPTALQ